MARSSEKRVRRMETGPREARRVGLWGLTWEGNGEGREGHPTAAADKNPSQIPPPQGHQQGQDPKGLVAPAVAQPRARVSGWESGWCEGKARAGWPQAPLTVTVS